MKSKKFVFAGASLLALASLAGCGGRKVTITVCLASEPQYLDPALNSAVDGATTICHLMSGAMRYVQKGSGELALDYDLAKLITKTTVSVTDHEYNETHDEWNEVHYPNGTRYTITLKEGLKWSNGEDLTAKDFVYSWNRATSATLAADYGYMFDCIADYNMHAAGAAESMAIKVDANNKLVFTVDLMIDVAHFNQLLAFPTFFPVNKTAVDAARGKDADSGQWATEAGSYVTCGAYTFTSWEHNSNILITKNPNYWDAANIKAESISFALSDDTNAMFASYESGQYDFIDDVPTDNLKEIKQKYPDEFKVAGQMGTYYVCFNLNSEKLAKDEATKAKIRRAYGLLLDRKYIVDNIGQCNQIPANGFVAQGITEPDGKTDWTNKNGPKHNGEGYYKKGETDAEKAANVAEAIELLTSVPGITYDATKKKFTGAPGFEYLYNTSAGHQKIGENIKDTLGNYGINVTLKNQEWNAFLETRKKGNYDVARNGWIADYNDPLTFLSMWTSNSGNNDCQFGKGAHAELEIYSADINRDGEKENNLTWAESYDELINQSNKETDATKRFAILHEAEDLLFETGAICPLYYYTDLYMCKKDVKGFFSSSLGYKYFMYVTRG